MKQRISYAVVFDREGKSHGAYVPDLPGWLAVASAYSRVRRLIQEAIALHLQDMRARGVRLPKPSAQVDYIKAQSAA